MLHPALHLMTVKATLIHASHLPTPIFSLALIVGHKAAQQLFGLQKEQAQH